MNLSRILSLMIALSASLLWLTNVRADESDWKYSVTPYVWLPSFNAKLKYQFPEIGGSAEVETYYLNKLNGAFMLAGNARRGKLSFYSDIIFLSISGNGSHVKALDFGGNIITSIIDTGTQTTIKGDVVTIGGGYTMLSSDNVNFDIIGGMRYLGIELSTDWRLSTDIAGPGGSGLTFPLSGNVNERVDLWDAIIGARGLINLGDDGRWNAPYYFDTGFGSSIHTWQAVIGLSYSYDWGDILFAYRHLSYGQDSDKLIQNLSLSGPMLGAKFKF